MVLNQINSKYKKKLSKGWFQLIQWFVRSILKCQNLGDDNNECKVMTILLWS